MVEKWLPIKLEDFKGYEVSNMGKIRTSNGKIRRDKDNGRGYRSMTLKKKGKSRTVYIHREVARCFLPDFDENLQVNHKDRDKTNNSLDNLEMVTAKENINHSKDNILRSRLQSQGKVVEVYDLNGNFIESFLGLGQGCKSRNLDPRSVQRVIKGEFKSYKGFVFKYSE